MWSTSHWVGVGLGLHTPTQPPDTQAWFEHAAPLLCQTPFTSHICGCNPLHFTALGVHAPVHAPLTQAWFVHATSGPHVPSGWHVSTALFEHCLSIGVHAPHCPFPRHALGHATGVFHVPSIWQVCTPFPEHRFVSGT